MAALDPRLLLQGYATGVFPMADDREAADVFWVEPRERTILPLDGFHLSRSLAKRIRSNRFTVTCDRDFAGVIAGCADRAETWISHPIEQAALRLHAWGHAHSIEVWEGERLAGGIYGVKLGRAFFGESMFSRARDASKVALAWLIARLRVGRFTLLDCQFMTDHLASLGAVTVPRDAYVGLLSAALARDGAPPPDWTALDVLLSSSEAGACSGASGKFITQLLGQTS
ncbi:leucyl/phenylalanyl-tRNA--protein transferase [Sphingomonas sp. GCM10030256]|uniref:leucyl/phenylalanyl-tRNA--protein transferase n=1 Tax=Sphingomonas sp. GCM10030256 TaxID=3273427 RepID=UPI003622BD69